MRWSPCAMIPRCAPTMNTSRHAAKPSSRPWSPPCANSSTPSTACSCTTSPSMAASSMPHPPPRPPRQRPSLRRSHTFKSFFPFAIKRESTGYACGCRAQHCIFMPKPGIKQAGRESQNRVRRQQPLLGTISCPPPHRLECPLRAFSWSVTCPTRRRKSKGSDLLCRSATPPGRVRTCAGARPRLAFRPL